MAQNVKILSLKIFLWIFETFILHVLHHMILGLSGPPPLLIKIFIYTPYPPLDDVTNEYEPN